MAIDDALLEAPARPEDYTVRFYRWLRPTVSLGYAQSWRSGYVPDSRAALRDVDRAATYRRAGVLHAGELTYSVVGDAEEGPLAGGIQATYSAIAEGLVVGFAVMGIRAEIVRSRGRRERAEPGACFASTGAERTGRGWRQAGGKRAAPGARAGPAARIDPSRSTGTRLAWRVLGSSGPCRRRGLNRFVPAARSTSRASVG